jgi:hypothetical protein
MLGFFQNLQDEVSSLEPWGSWNPLQTEAVGSL